MSGPILLQGAMDVETDVLIAALDRGREECIGGFSFWQGLLGGREAVVCRTDIATVCCAAATAVGIAHFHPQVVINQGIAGAHREELHVGDIVVGRECVPIHDLKMPPRGRGEGSDPFAWEFHSHRDGEPALPVYRADPVWAARLERTPYGGRKLAGRLGSGDVFNREADRIAWLRERAGEDCEDMESVAAYQICARMGTPCVGVRIISNNELTGEPYCREVGRDLQRFVLEALK